MKSVTRMEVKSTEEEEAKAKIWEYVLGFTPAAVVKCAIELQIADVLESHGGAMSFIDLSSALACSPSTLYRIMRYMTHRGFFKVQDNESSTNEEALASSICYTNTPLSRLLLKNGEKSMASFVLMQNNPTMLAPWHKLSSRALVNGTSAFEAANGEDAWKHFSQNEADNKLFNDAMACHARLAVSEILERCPHVFEGIGCLVDVGGGYGTALGNIINACPMIRGINFDLPHVVFDAPRHKGVEHVGGNMFEQVPKADAVFIMGVLHNWGDNECIQILSKCREAIPKETGKVIIVDVVIVEGEEEEYSDVRLAMDMVMMAHTEKGKERTEEEWEGLVKGAGFSSFKVNYIGSFESIIEAYP